MSAVVVVAEQKQKHKPNAIIVGGSIGGTSCAKALTLAGWEVVVIDKTRVPSIGNPTGATLAIDPLARKIIESWLRPQPHLLSSIALPLTTNQHYVTDGENKVSRVLIKDDNFNSVAVHWSDLHSLLYNTLPPEIFLWGHQFLSFCYSHDKSSVKVKAEVLQTGEVVEIQGDLLIGADGIRSSIRRNILPHVHLRYAGYCAWRGVVDFSENGLSATVKEFGNAYPDLGKGLCMGMGSGSHIVLAQLMNHKFTWTWYINQPEPDLQGKTATMKLSGDMIEGLHQKAEEIWTPEVARLIKETKEPFLTVIHDLDALEHIFHDRVVLMGDAAHPTTPHCARSTNMSIIDAAVLGQCLTKWGPQKLHKSLEEYQSIRAPVTSAQVLHSRQLGRMKQGLPVPGREPFDPTRASLEDCQLLLSKSWPLVDVVPPILDSLLH